MVAQLWDRDLFKFNDHIAEGQLDLGPYFIKAYKTRETVKLFPTIGPKMQEEMQKADVSSVCTLCVSYVLVVVVGKGISNEVHRYTAVLLRTAAKSTLKVDVCIREE